MKLHSIFSTILLSASSMVVLADAYTFTTFADPNAIYPSRTYASGINNSGQVTGSVETSTGTYGFLYNSNTRTFSSNYLNDPNYGSNLTQANGINNSGQIVGAGYSSRGTAPGVAYAIGSGYIFNGVNYAKLNDPHQVAYSPGFSTFYQTTAQGINDSGTVVGYYSRNYGSSGFEYSGGVYSTLNYPDPLAYYTQPFGINNSGVVVGSYTLSGASYGFIYDGSTYTTLNDPDSAAVHGTFATGINNKGEVAGYYLDTSYKPHGFLYNNGIFTTINESPTATSTAIYGINDNGQLVGTFTSPTGGGSFIATPSSVPAPAAVWLFGSALAGLVGFNRCKLMQQVA